MCVCVCVCVWVHVCVGEMCLRVHEWMTEFVCVCVCVCVCVFDEVSDTSSRERPR